MPLYVPTGLGKALSIKTHSKHLQVHVDFESVSLSAGPTVVLPPTPWTWVIPTNTSDLGFEAHLLGVLLLCVPTAPDPMLQPFFNLCPYR